MSEMRSSSRLTPCDLGRHHRRTPWRCASAGIAGSRSTGAFSFIKPEVGGLDALSIICVALTSAADMLEFQQAVTGYKVVHDESVLLGAVYYPSPRMLTTSRARVLATVQESRLLGGSRRQELCRLQIWTAPPAQANASKTPLSVSTSTAMKKRLSGTTLKNPSVFASSSVSSQRKKSTFSSSSSIPENPDISHPHRSEFAIPADSTTVFAPPIAPCIVLFAHKAPDRADREGTSRSFLVIDSERPAGCGFRAFNASTILTHGFHKSMPRP